MYFVIFCLTIFVYNTFVFVHSAESFDDSKGGEYCQFENFNPKCPANSVVLVTKALFGRMRQDRCITEKEVRGFGNLIHDQKYLGCHVDVQDMIGDWCSMTNECLVKVSDTRLTDLEPCLPGLNMHLETEYTCVPVYSTEGSSCTLPVFHNGKYLLSESMKSRKCGTLHDPWILEAMKGQKVVVKYFNFKSGASSSCEDATNIVLQDGGGNINSTLCRNNWFNDEGVQREPSFHKSVSNVVKMFATDPNLSKNKFALKIEAEGCLDIIPPEDAWLKRTNDDIVLGCYSSKQTWYLRCENNQWTGVIGNCSHLDQSPAGKKTDEELVREKMIMSKSHQVLAIVAIFGMGVVVCSAIVCIGAVCARRYKLATKVKGFDSKGQNLMMPENAYNQHTYNANYDYKSGGYNNGTIGDGKNNLIHSGSSDKEQTYFVLEDDQTMAVK